jgi:hypothetical protein
MFEDCIVIEGIGGHDVALNVVRQGAFESLDDYRFYGQWVAAGVCGDVIGSSASFALQQQQGRRPRHAAACATPFCR